MSTPLLNRKAVRKEALRLAQNRNFNRVSQTFLDRIEDHVRMTLAAEIHRHPSIGKTLR